MSNALGLQRQQTELICYLNYAPAAVLRTSPWVELPLSLVMQWLGPISESAGIARVDRSATTGQIRLVFTTVQAAQQARQQVLLQPVNLGVAMVIDLEPIESPRTWPFADRLDNPRPHEQACLVPALDPQSPSFSPDAIMWSDLQHCARWAALTQAICVPNEGFVASPRMPVPSDAVPDVPAGAQRSSEAAGVEDVASPSERSAQGTSSVSPVVSSIGNVPPPHALESLCGIRIYPIRSCGNINDLVGRTTGLIDARLHDAKINGSYWATALYDTAQHAQQAQSTLQDRIWGGAPIHVHLWDSFGTVDTLGKTSKISVMFSPIDKTHRLQSGDAEELEQLLRRVTSMQPEALLYESFPDHHVHYFKLLYSTPEQVKQVIQRAGGAILQLLNGTATIPLDCDSVTDVWDFGEFHTE